MPGPEVTRGALYHHFEDKRDLFRAVHERVEEELIERIGAAMGEVADPWELILAGTRSFLDACEEPAVKQIALIDAPAVLGWDEWREIDERYGLGLTRTALGGAIDAGVLRPLPLEPLSHLLLAALSEAALMIANAEDPASTRQEVEAALIELLEGLDGRLPSAPAPRRSSDRRARPVATHVLRRLHEAVDCRLGAAELRRFS